MISGSSRMQEWGGVLVATPNRCLHQTKPLVTPLACARVAPIDFAGEAQRYANGTQRRKRQRRGLIMSRHLVFALLLAASATFGGCGELKSSSVDTESIKENIRQSDLALLRAEEARDLDGVMECIAPHAVFQPPGVSPIVGLEAIRKFYDTQWFKLPFIEISGAPESIVVGASGDMAYVDGRSRMVVEISGERTVAAGKYLGVWLKISGKWQLAAISWSANEMTR